MVAETWLQPLDFPFGLQGVTYFCGWAFDVRHVSGGGRRTQTFYLVVAQPDARSAPPLTAQAMSNPLAINYIHLPHGLQYNIAL